SQMAQEVGEESLVLCSEWVKNRYRIQGFARWRWLLQVAGVAKTGWRENKSFDSSSKTVLEFKASLIAARFAK
ncbi:hypothetical protein QF021_000001, partial [Acidovorax delafieldii]|uniref:hypothetical protein n=1 Tax=Acidovorax delafieldii TaxID=47920 RepID=UPI002861EFC2